MGYQSAHEQEVETRLREINQRMEVLVKIQKDTLDVLKKIEKQIPGDL